MRINQYIAQATGLSRRKADDFVANGKVTINGRIAKLGENISNADKIAIEGKVIESKPFTTIILNKPAGYVCSREGQDGPTIYELLPKNLHHLKYAGRLDKESSGLLLLTNDGKLLYELTHPSKEEIRKYYAELESPLKANDIEAIQKGIALNDGMSTLRLNPADDTKKHWQIEMKEGRNRQIRRTFGALGYTVTKLVRQTHGKYSLGDLKPGQYKEI